ncbi:MAG TPA: SpoVR family protein, partial [Gammaproteobacteria bacterium]|nr:SpoVR family protein [Gammaproteobacteria bacterium]
MNEALQAYAGRLEALAQSNGLDYYPVQFEEVPSSFMMEIAVYGLPVRMPHWSFGVRYIYQLVQHRMGHSRLFEVVFPGNPGRAYLAGNNSLQENTLVTAHVLGHADFAKNNSLFKRSQEQVGYRIVEQAAAHARQIGTAVQQYGQTRVEQVLDAALSLEAHIDPIQLLRRDRYPQYVEAARPAHESGFQKRFESLPGSAEVVDAPLERARAPIPAAPER